MKGDCTSHFLTHLTYYQEFISGGYSIIYLNGYTCSLPSPIKYERTFYQVENRTEKQKGMLLQGRIWNEISDTNWKNNNIVMETYGQKSTKLW